MQADKLLHVILPFSIFVNTLASVCLFVCLSKLSSQRLCMVDPSVIHGWIADVDPVCNVKNPIDFGLILSKLSSTKVNQSSLFLFSLLLHTLSHYFSHYSFTRLCGRARWHKLRGCQEPPMA